MNPKIVIRSETDADVSAINEVTVAAFKTLEISNHTEQFIIEALRAAKVLAVSLVAEMDGRVEGLMCVRVAGLEELVPPMHLGLVQADLLEHGDPFLYVHMVLHMRIC